ncbi:MAG: glucose-6-phosphate isomerase [Acidobacteriota bacterium]
MPRFPPLAQSFADERLATRIWNKETGLFAPPNAPRETQHSIAARLGWLQAPSVDERAVAELLVFADETRHAGLTDVYLLGMGGSSLCAEVLRDVAAGRSGERCRLTLLDTTDERAIADATDTLRPEHALFLVASKSGTTVEVLALESYFRAVMTDARGGSASRHFIAITDPGTPLETLARTQHYRRVFLNPPDIGGRYSVLSNFGLVPGALLGVDLGTLLKRARRMADDCRANIASNPGLALGAFIAEQASQGRDKLTVLLPAPLAPLGAWIEQLVAESTGKNGGGLLPIVDEPLEDDYLQQVGPDRAFVAILTPQSPDVASVALALEKAGKPIFRIQTTAEHLGAEFFRWEFATAVAGSALEINPFDEPDVRDAKARTKAQLDAFDRTGSLQPDPPLSRAGNGFRREARPREPIGPNRRYVAILDYRPADLTRRSAIALVRRDIRRLTRVATTHGVGPRYLHSSGQYHKGGPNTGLFILLTADDATKTPIPGTRFTFSVLKHAQALGDFEALAAAGRHVVHYHFDDREADVSTPIMKVVSEIGPRRGPKPDPIR